tara:strand:+ start:274 stop:474 length:201 start_codon:yes stop_codon:yes gene_type:complete
MNRFNFTDIIIAIACTTMLLAISSIITAYIYERIVRESLAPVYSAEMETLNIIKNMVEKYDIEVNN